MEFILYFLSINLVILKNPFRKLIESFYEETKCPVLLNTSFNVKGQPIVNSPDDAIKCFLSTNIDVLAIGKFVVTKDNE